MAKTKEEKQAMAAHARAVKKALSQPRIIEAPSPQVLYTAKRTLAHEIADFTAIKPLGDRYESAKRILAAIWPEQVDPKAGFWNEWTERSLRQFCSDETAVISRGNRVKTTIMSGCAAASKTFTSGMYAFLWWAVAPERSIVIFTSTTREMIRRRIWPVVQHFFHTAKTSDGNTRDWKLFNKVESRTTIQYIGDSDEEAPSDKNAIFAMAVAHGETQKAAHNLRGMHAERILLVIDEANGTPEAIFEAIPNQRKGCKNYEAIIIGNPISHLDPHGQCARPKDGWGVIGEETAEWETAGVDKWQIEPGVCLRFDGKQSPNVKADDDHWPFIYTTSDWKRACDPKKEKTLAYWSQDRGLWPPDGFVNAIINEAMLAKYDPENGLPFVWRTRKRMVAFLDPAFGGDDCKLYMAEVGDIDGGKDGIQIMKDVTITFEYANREEIDYIIARRCIEECKAHGVEPECFGLDRTGTGRGVAAVIAAEWSNSIHQVEFGGMATDRASSTADGRPAREVYYNRTTEMAWSMREFLEAGQLRGIPHQARLEACLRTYTVTGRRYKIEPKGDFKARLGYSPDSYDCLCLIGGTLISTPNGNIPIEQLKIGDSVFTPFGSAKIIRTLKKEAECVRVNFSNGQSLTGIGEHKAYTTHGWCRLDALSVDTEMESVQDRWKWIILNLLFTRVGDFTFKALANTIHPGTKRHRRDYFTGLYGLSILGQLKKVFTFITKTATGQITESRISNYLHPKNIAMFIGLSTGKILCSWSRLGQDMQKLWKLLRRGIQVQMAESGIASTGLMLPISKNSSSSNAPVSFAELFFRGINSGHRSAVHQNAGTSTESEKKKSATAFIVEGLLCAIGISRRRIAPIGVPISVPGKLDVFDLTLDSENAYYANGLLVENCGVCDVVRQIGVGPRTANTQSKDTAWDKLVQKQIRKPELELYEDSTEGDIFA